jgi:dolichol kinase
MPVNGEAPGAPETAPTPRRLEILATEAARKVIHVGTATVAALLAWTLPTTPARILFVGMALVALAVDLARLSFPRFRAQFERTLAPMLRSHEGGRITGATTLAIAFAVIVLLFPREMAVAGIAFAGYADAAGALVGRAFGMHRYPSGKSLEGTIAFTVVAFVVAWTLPSLGIPAALGVAIVLGALESAPLPVDDNLLVPIAGAALAWIASAVL